MNENGELFAGICTGNSLTIGGTIFPHKSIHITTWVLPGGLYKTQIDKCVADMASDHNLLVGEIRLKIEAIRMHDGQSRPRRFDINKLQQQEVREDIQMR